MQDRTDAGLGRCITGWMEDKMNAGQNGCMSKLVMERMDAYRKNRDRRYAGSEVFRIRGMQDKRDEGQR